MPLYLRYKPNNMTQLGHFGYTVRDLQKQVNYYTTTFNLVPSDFIYAPSSESLDGRMEVGIFAHIDLGETYVDHHSFFMTLGTNQHVHHCSFEVHDFDTQLLGHQ